MKPDSVQTSCWKTRHQRHQHSSSTSSTYVVVSRCQSVSHLRYVGMHSKNAQHVAKLEALWFELCQKELAVEHVQLPLSFLLDRILNILPKEYFEFKSVWKSRPRKQRTVKVLTEEMCLHEQQLKQLMVI